MDMKRRDKYEFNKDVIIIAQSAFWSSDDREKAILAGCNLYLKTLCQSGITG
jgi:hypothetical protein